MVDNNWHGTMSWLETTLERRQSPKSMWENANSAIVVAMNYAPDFDPIANLEKPDKANISVYARNRDYHDLVKGKLKQMAGKLVAWTGGEVKVFVDTAPLMEKPLAAKAGIGWQGKHTNLVSRDFGSWLFLGIILTSVKLEPDEAVEDHCGNCRACLDICPTNAFPGPYKIDARRCISYLTIEHDGLIDEEFREPMGNRIFGCDDCLAVCPWNKFASASSEIKLTAREDLMAPDLKGLLALDDGKFRKLFSGSPIKRIGRNRFVRNVLIAAGNSGAKRLADDVVPHLLDNSSMVRGTAIWALSRLCTPKTFNLHYDHHSASEPDNEVQLEWNKAKARIVNSPDP